MNKTKSIKLAREMVGDIHKLGNNYSYLWFDESVDCWRDGYCGQYWMTKIHRAERLIQLARGKMNPEADPYCQYDGGDWTNYLD